MPLSLIYARKSTESDDRQILSINSQIEELKTLALRRGLTVDDVLTESRSAKAPGRPVFGALMRRVEKGQVGTIFCWKMDRLARNHLDTGSVLQALADGKLLSVVTPERTYTADGNDRFLGNFEFGIATKFIDDLRANTKRGNRARFRNGWPNFRPPVGYLEDHVKKEVIIDPERFPLVRKMWDLLLAGAVRPREILRLATEEWNLRTRQTARQGGKPLTTSMFYRLFENPFYAGIIRLRSGEVYQGRHQAMVTGQEFERAQEILGRPGRPRPERHEFAYAGLLRCGRCGGILTAEQHVKPSGRRYVYYRCHARTSGQPCGEPTLPERVFDTKFAVDLERMALPEEAATWILDNLHGTLASDLGQRQAAHASLQKELHQAAQEGENLLTLRLRAQVDEDTFEKRRVQIQERQVTLRLKLDQPEAKPEEVADRINRLLQFSAKAASAFRRGDAVQRRQIVRTVASNFRVQDRTPLYSAKEPFSFFEQSVLSPTWCRIAEDLRTWVQKCGDFWLPDLDATDDEDIEPSDG